MAREDGPQSTQESHDDGPARPGARPRTLVASDLLGDGRVLHIEHRGEVYKLRITRNDRLILTK